jgi:hypothetical protein
VDIGESGAGVDSGVAATVEADAGVTVDGPVETGAATDAVPFPGDGARDAEPFCATANWKMKAVGMIKNLMRI